MKYYVLSEGENPTKIFFEEALAREEGMAYSDAYLDVFDKNGDKVDSMKLVWSDNDVPHWTKEF